GKRHRYDQTLDDRSALVPAASVTGDPGPDIVGGFPVVVMVVRVVIMMVVLVVVVVVVVVIMVMAVTVLTMVVRIVRHSKTPGHRIHRLGAVQVNCLAHRFRPCRHPLPPSRPRQGAATG